MATLGIIHFIFRRFSINHIHIARLKLNKMVFYAFVLAVCATTLLTMLYYFYIPLRVDGGWYTYSAFCLSTGRDPGENYSKVNDLKDKPGIKAVFDVGDDFRRSIRVFPMALWFMAFGTSIWAVKLFGILEYLILLTIMYLLLQQISRDRNVLLLCFVLFFMDGSLIWWASTNLRPDIMITVLTLVVVLFIRMDDIDHRLLIFFGGVLSMFCLTLMRVSSAVSLVLLISYLLIELSISWHYLLPFRKWFYASIIAAGVIGFVLRDQILDMVLPSKYSVHSVYQMEQYVYGTMKHMNLLEVLVKELRQWWAYFRLSNIGELFAILLAFALFIVRRFFQADKTSRHQVMHIGLSCLLAMGVLAFLDPTHSIGHRLPIVSFFIVLLAGELELVSVQWIRKSAISLLLVIVLISAGTRLLQGIHVSAKGMENRYSNATVAETIGNIFNSVEKHYVVIGATELWPYFDPKSNVLIVDVRKGDLGRLADVIKLADFILIDKFYAEEDWESNFSRRYPRVKLTKIREVGDPLNGWYFLKVTKPSFAEP